MGIELEKTISEEQSDITEENTENKKKEENEVTPEEKIKELEEKLIRTFAEMENQRRRFEKERDDAFNYGGFAFAKETLNLIDKMEKDQKINIDKQNEDVNETSINNKTNDVS